MTIKEAVLQCLDDHKGLANSTEVYNLILEKKNFNFSKDSKTPINTISALLGDFIRLGDTRVKRVKQEGGVYAYYLTKHEQHIGTESFADNSESSANRIDKPKTYHERDLHKLLSSFLKESGIYSKTIFHESSNGKDSNQIWTHPDMVGIQFFKLQSSASQSLLKATNQVDSFSMFSYELKREINNDTDLKQAFFQAVSNSSWATYGFLVAFEYSGNLLLEMERLNQAFGIGIIKLNANPYKSTILFHPTKRKIDFKTVDKLCKINKDFEKFIEQTEKLITAVDRYYASTVKELDEFCDDCFQNDSEFINYCKDKHIPIDEKVENQTV